MDEKEFTLEDIIREFGEDAPEPEQIAGEEFLEPEELPEIVSEELPEMELEEEIFLQPPVQNAGAVTGDTIRMDAIRLPKGQVHNAEPVEETEPAQDPEPQEETQEPFSDQWEPEYEQPMGEYLPPQPILIHPRSRLRELKKKLVAGPEKRYYALMEKGLWKLQALLFLSAIVVLISAISTGMYAFGMVQENRLRLMVFGQFFAMLVSALLGSYQLIEGVTDLLHKRFTLKTLLVFTFLFCCVDGIMGLKLLRVPCCAAFSLEMMMCLWSAYQKRNTEMGQMDTMRKANNLNAVCACPDYRQESNGLLQTEGQVEHFMDTYQQTPEPEKLLNKYAIIALIAGVAVGITAGILQRDIFAGVQVAAVCLLAAVPATTFISLTRPMAVLERKLHAVGSVLCGWQSVEKLSEKTFVPLQQEDLFPAGTVRMNGVKFYGSRSPEEVIAYGTAVLAAAQDGLAPLFTQVLDSRNGLHYDAEDLCSYEGGLGGQVQGEEVLIGMLSCLRELGVEIPEGIRVNQAVCVAVEGELCGVFAVSFEKAKASAASLVSLCGYRGLRALILAKNFMLTESFVRNVFGIKSHRLQFATPEETAQLAEKVLPEDPRALLLTVNDDLLPVAYGVAGARALRTASKLGALIHILGGALGLCIMMVLTILGALELLTPANMFLYQLVWAIPGFLITEWTRSI